MAFGTILEDKLLAGEIPYKMWWCDFITEFCSYKAAFNMMDPSQPGSTAKKLFEHLMSDICDQHKKMKSYIKHHFKRSNFKMVE
jgi:hypothetical protein